MYDFLKRYTNGSSPPFCNDILKIDDTLTKIPYLTVPKTKIEPDNWELFWQLWTEQKAQRVFSNSSIWEGLYIYVNPKLTDNEIQTHYPKIVNPNHFHDWSTIFPKMFDQILNLMPYKVIHKISLASNVERVPIHMDPIENLFPWPNTLRVIIHDTNTRPTFYLTKWPEHSYNLPIINDIHPQLNKTYFLEKTPDADKIYVDLPEDSNTFVYNNGVYLHGADIANFKIIMLIWGEIDELKWKLKLHEINNDNYLCNKNK